MVSESTTHQQAKYLWLGVGLEVSSRSPSFYNGVVFHSIWFNRFNDAADKLDFIAADVGHLRELIRPRRDELKAELQNHVLGSPEHTWLSKELAECANAFGRIDHFEKFFASNRQALDLVAAKALAIAEFADDQ